MPNVMAALSNIGGALCESSVIPFLVPRHKVWLKPIARVPCSNAANIRERTTWTQSEFCPWQNSVTGQQPPKMYMYIVPTQETAKHCAKCGWPPVRDVAAVTNARRETRWNLLGCPKLVGLNRSQPLVGRSSPYCGTCEGDMAVGCSVAWIKRVEFIQPVKQPVAQTGWMFVYTIHPVVQPIAQPVVQPYWQPVVSCKRGITVICTVASARSIARSSQLLKWQRTILATKLSVITIYLLQSPA